MDLNSKFKVAIKIKSEVTVGNNYNIRLGKRKGALEFAP